MMMRFFLLLFLTIYSLNASTQQANIVVPLKFIVWLKGADNKRVEVEVNDFKINKNISLEDNKLSIILSDSLSTLPATDNSSKFKPVDEKPPYQFIVPITVVQENPDISIEVDPNALSENQTYKFTIAIHRRFNDTKREISVDFSEHAIVTISQDDLKEENTDPPVDFPQCSAQCSAQCPAQCSGYSILIHGNDGVFQEGVSPTVTDDARAFYRTFHLIDKAFANLGFYSFHFNDYGFRNLQEELAPLIEDELLVIEQKPSIINISSLFNGNDDRLVSFLKKNPKPVYIVLVGHGNDNKFHIDTQYGEQIISSEDIATWLENLRNQIQPHKLDATVIIGSCHSKSFYENALQNISGIDLKVLTSTDEYGSDEVTEPDGSMRPARSDSYKGHDENGVSYGDLFVHELFSFINDLSEKEESLQLNLELLKNVYGQTSYIVKKFSESLSPPQKTAMFIVNNPYEPDTLDINTKNRQNFILSYRWSSRRSVRSNQADGEEIQSLQNKETKLTIELQSNLADVYVRPPNARDNIAGTNDPTDSSPSELGLIPLNITHSNTLEYSLKESGVYEFFYLLRDTEGKLTDIVREDFVYSSLINPANGIVFKDYKTFRDTMWVWEFIELPKDSTLSNRKNALAYKVRFFDENENSIFDSEEELLYTSFGQQDDYFIHPSYAYTQAEINLPTHNEWVVELWDTENEQLVGISHTRAFDATFSNPDGSACITENSIETKDFPNEIVHQGKNNIVARSNRFVNGVITSTPGFTLLETQNFNNTQLQDTGGNDVNITVQLKNYAMEGNLRLAIALCSHPTHDPCFSLNTNNGWDVWTLDPNKVHPPEKPAPLRIYRRLENVQLNIRLPDITYTVPESILKKYPMSVTTYAFLTENNEVFIDEDFIGLGYHCIREQPNESEALRQ